MLAGILRAGVAPASPHCLKFAEVYTFGARKSVSNPLDT